LKSLCLIFLSVLFFSGPAWSQSEVDHLAVASMMIKNGYPDRAQTALDKINLDEDYVDLSKYKALLGMIQLSQKNYKKAEALFEEALSEKNPDPEIFMYLAESQFMDGRVKEARESIQKTDAESQKTPGYYILYSNILWAQGEKIAAWDVLRNAPRDLSKGALLKQQFRFLMEEGLYLTAKDLIFSGIKEGLSPKDVAVMAGLLREKGQIKEARSPLEWAHIKWPRSREINLELAFNYLKTDHTLAAASLLESAARRDPDLAPDAVELLRNAGKIFRAEILLSLIHDENKELRQRVGIYLGKGRYDLVTLLSPRLAKSGVLSDQEMRYALAYSFYATGDFKKAEWHLNQISQENLFSKALEIKKTMAECRETPWVCHENF